MFERESHVSPSFSPHVFAEESQLENPTNGIKTGAEIAGFQWTHLWLINLIRMYCRPHHISDFSRFNQPIYNCQSFMVGSQVFWVNPPDLLLICFLVNLYNMTYVPLGFQMLEHDYDWNIIWKYHHWFCKREHCPICACLSIGQPPIHPLINLHYFHWTAWIYVGLISIQISIKSTSSISTI